MPEYPTDVAAVPGIAAASPRALGYLADIAARRAWDVDGLAAAISHESGWNPKAKNPSGGAVGLLQFLPSTLARWRLTPSQVLAWDAAEQLDLVERFFSEWEAVGYRIGPDDFLAFGLGVGRAPSSGGVIPDSAVLYEAGSAGALANAPLADSSGAITMGGMRSRLRSVVDRAGASPRVPLPPFPELGPSVLPSSPAGGRGGGGLWALVALTVAGIFAGTLLTRGRGRRRA